MTRIKKYFLTVCITLIVVFSFCLCIELELMFRVEKRICSEDTKVENIAKFASIEELEKKLMQDPNNYLISIRLAQIYESLNDYNKAKEFYSNALKLSSRSNLSLYYFALFCARNDLVVLSSSLAEELSGNNKKIISYKARIYLNIADSFFRQKQYEAANKAYKIAYKYAKSLNDEKLYLEIKNKYVESYLKLADDNIENEDVAHAISNLKNALKIKPAPQGKYRLGLIYIDTDKHKAEKLIYEAFKDNPFIVNPYIYNTLLEDLIAESKESGNYNSNKYYSMKLKRYKKTLSKVYVFKDDILIGNSGIIHNKRFLSEKDNYYLKFDIKNNSKEKIEQLYLEAEIFVNKRKFTINKKIFTHAHSIKANETIENVKIYLSDDIDFHSLENSATIKYWAKKSTKAPWVLIKIDTVKL